MNSLYLSVLALTLALLWMIYWSSKQMTKARWQIFATVPIRHDGNGNWHGLNFTWYGALTAIAFGLSIALIVVLAGSVQINVFLTFSLTLIVTALSLVASRMVAQWVEKIPGTHTVGGALFALSILVGPLILVLNYLLTATKVVHAHSGSQLIALLAALAIAYVYGEGVGRIACISFGCCWGRPVRDLRGTSKYLFQDRHFVFDGPTKKIAYASGLAGVPVVPIQSITAVIHVLIGAVAIVLFYQQAYWTCLMVSMGGTQIWRFASEFLRADFRGAGAISAYQWMALATVPVLCVHALLIQSVFQSANPQVVTPNFYLGLQALWSPGPLVVLQLVMVYVFAKTGKSSVTKASLRLQMSHE